ncbi:MAG TPA: hypothetical protein VGG46_01105, partial [Terriglobales bacterium]
MSKLGAAGSFGIDSRAAEEEAGAPASWIDNGMIDAGGTHEPLIFVRRRGGESVDARRIYESQQSEELIRRL